MFYRIVIFPFAAIAISMSCIADASAGGFFGFRPGFARGGGFFAARGFRPGFARGGGFFAAPGFRPGFARGGGYGFRPMPRMGGFAGGGYRRPGIIGAAGGGYFAAAGVRPTPKPRIPGIGPNGPVGGGGAATATGFGLGGPTAGGAAAGTPYYYAPASYDSNAACGSYPYPPCKERAKAKAKKTPAVEPDD